jgi:hydrogenase nickel incorporation protein HypA/HybF
MHELGIANSVLQAAQAEMGRHPGALPLKIGVRIGELAGVDPGALAFSFEALTADTAWQRVALEIVTSPREHRCPACAAVFRVVDSNFACPSCGEGRTVCVGGGELELMYLEMEES